MIYQLISPKNPSLCTANFIYRDARSPGRAGFRRSSYNDPYGSYYSHRGRESWSSPGGQGSYTRPGYMHISQRLAAEIRTFWRVFTSSGSASLTAALGGLFIGGILFLEPVFSSAWERNNKGKLFKQIEEDVIERKRAQLMALQAERTAREAAAAAAAEAEAGAAASAALAEAREGTLASADKSIETIDSWTAQRGEERSGAPDNTMFDNNIIPISARAVASGVKEITQGLPTGAPHVISTPTVPSTAAAVESTRSLHTDLSHAAPLLDQDEGVKIGGGALPDKSATSQTAATPSLPAPAE